MESGTPKSEEGGAGGSWLYRRLLLVITGDAVGGGEIKERLNVRAREASHHLFDLG